MPGETASINLTFHSRMEDESVWHDAKLIIEKSNDDDPGKWEELQTISFKGSTGRPKLEIEPEVLDFGFVSLGNALTKSFKLKNSVLPKVNYDSSPPQGTSSTKYELKPTWERPIFSVADEYLTGELDVGAFVEIPITYNPPDTVKHVESILITTSLDKSSFQLTGHGAVFKIATDTLPKQIDFGKVDVGELKQQTVWRCMFDLISLP